MDLKAIARNAIVEAEEEDGNGYDMSEPLPAEDSVSTEAPILTQENPDGTVTYSVVVSFDPDVQKKMSKAMPKGMKRDDLADDLGDTEGEVEETDDIVVEETAEDSAPRGVFAAVLDEFFPHVPVAAEDASPSRHSKTPLENCRAKDPMYCPYHGDKAIKAEIEKMIGKAGLTGLQVSVEKQGNGFLCKVNDPKPGMTSNTNSSIAQCIAMALINKPGVRLSMPTGASNGFSQFNTALAQTNSGDVASTVVQVERPEDIDISMLDEWIDDLVQDISADASLMQELDPQDMRDLLEARDKIDALQPPSQRDPLNPSPYELALKDARDKYHALRAQVDFRDVKTPADAQKMQADIANDVARMSADYHSAKTAVDQAKQALFKNGRFPNGFAKTHSWAADYNKASTGIGYFAQKRVDDATAAIANAGNDIKALRTALAELDYAKESYANALDRFQKAVPDFMDSFSDWAMNDPSVQPAQFKAAFPNKAPSVPQPQPPPATPTAPTQPATPPSPPATQGGQSQIASVQDRFKNMTDAKARTILSNHFSVVCDSKADLKSPLSKRYFQKRCREVSSLKSARESQRFLAAAMEYMDEKYPNAKFPRVDNFLPSRKGRAYGVAFYYYFKTPGSVPETALAWSKRTQKEQNRNNLNTANGKRGYNVSENPPPDTRDQTTIYHEMAHFLYNQQNDLNKLADWKAAKSKAGKTANWVGSVSQYAKKNDTELHSEVVSMVMRPDYQKGALPQPIEEYVYEKVLGLAPGQY